MDYSHVMKKVRNSLWTGDKTLKRNNGVPYERERMNAVLYTRDHMYNLTSSNTMRNHLVEDVNVNMLHLLTAYTCFLGL